MGLVTEVLLLVVSLGLVVACGAFVAAEFSFITVDRPTVEQAAADGDGRAAGVRTALRSLSTQLSGAQVRKNLALARPERTALALGPPLVLVVRVLRPLVGLLNAIANLVLRAVDVPPNQLVTLPLDGSPADVEALAARTGYSRFPVRDAAGRLSGYAHLKDALAADSEEEWVGPMRVERIRPLARINADDKLRTVLSAMQRSGSHLAQVTDSAGQVLGVVALGDVLEELVGQVRDEATL